MARQPDVFLKKINESFSQIITDNRGILLGLHDEFAFFAKNYQFSPKYKNRVWDGKIRLLSLRDGFIPSGLGEHVKAYCDRNGYSFATDTAKQHVGTTQEILDFCKNLNPHAGGKPISYYDYQLSAIVKAVRSEKRLLLSPTSSGKSLIVYSIVKWFSELKTLIIVPTVSLVAQLYSDFDEYDNWRGWVKDDCHKVYAGKDKNSNARVIISTWQSIAKLPPEYFHQFEQVIVDEAHTATGASIRTVMEQCINASVRIGTTGTIEDAEASETQLIGLFGPIYQVTTTKKLMDAGTVSNLKIKCLVLSYPDEIRKVKRDYNEESDFVTGHTGRNEVIKLLAGSLTGNVLILVKNIDSHLIPLYDLLKDLPGRNVTTVYGKTPVDDRERIRVICEKSNNNVILASYQTMSTGVNIKNLQHVIFGASSKSKIRILQSIGRGLRLDGKDNKMWLYDLIDDLSWKSRKGYFMQHFEDRLAYYDREQFNYTLKKIKIV